MLRMLNCPTRGWEKEREMKAKLFAWAKKRPRHEVDDDVGGTSNVPVNIES